MLGSLPARVTSACAEQPESMSCMYEYGCMYHVYVLYVSCIWMHVLCMYIVCMYVYGCMYHVSCILLYVCMYCRVYIVYILTLSVRAREA